MNFKFHNTITIQTNGKQYVFFNTMLNSVFEALKNFNPYNKYISLGTGEPSKKQNNFKLTNFLKTFSLELDCLQDDVSLSTLFVKKTVLIDDSTLNNLHIKELGLSDGKANPTIFNYISLIGADTPNGIVKEANQPLILTICVYLEINENQSFILTSGRNKFIDYLLGEGLKGDVFAIRGNNYSPNSRVFREVPLNSNKHKCQINVTNNNGLNIDFVADIGKGETNEIVFLIENSPFARINTQEFKQPITEVKTFLPKTHYVLDLGNGIKSIDSVKNLTTNQLETDIYSSHYATDFGDSITLPFYNMFDWTTPRFLSKDGDKIFFVLNDSIFAYSNLNYEVKQIETGEISIQSIFKIVSFENYVFVITKLKPFIYAYLIKDNKMINAEINFSNIEIFASLENLFDADVTLSKDGTFMFGAIVAPEHFGHVIYFNFDNDATKFVVNSYQKSEYYFSYLLAMYKNNFSDAKIIFLKEGEHSVDCRLVTFEPNKQIVDVFTNMALLLTSDTKEIYTKNRAIIVEKTTPPFLWIYYYPQIYRYNLPLLSNEDNDYISTNLIYLIQKKGMEYKIYNLVGYNTPTEFEKGFPIEIKQEKILGFEFLKDSLLIFVDNKDKPIVAYNFKLDSMLVENVSTNEDQYEVQLQRFNLIGNNNEGVVATFSATINI